MVNKKIGVVGVVVVVAGLLSFGAFAGPKFGPKPGDLLEGDERDACEIKMCLETGGIDYEQCDRALKVWEETRPEERPELLRKCPMKED